MSEEIKILSNIRILRAHVRNVELEVLEDMLEKLKVVVDEQRQIEASQLKMFGEKQAKVEAFRQKLFAEGIDPSELVSPAKPIVKLKVTRARRPARYKYTDVDGTEKTWTGQGRTPKVISTAIKSGRNLEDFMV